MKNVRKFPSTAPVLGILILFYIPAGYANQGNAATLTPDQSAVYLDFIQSLKKMNFKYLASRTFLLDMSSVEKDAACLKGVTVHAPDKSKEGIHILRPQLVQDHAIHVVGRDDEFAILKQRDIAKVKRRRMFMG